MAPEMLQFTLAQTLGLGLAKSHLDRRVSIPLGRFLLSDVAGTNLNNRHRHDDAFVEDLRHADLSTQ
jgi:hypothetical protein